VATSPHGTLPGHDPPPGTCMSAGFLVVGERTLQCHLHLIARSQVLSVLSALSYLLY